MDDAELPRALIKRIAKTSLTQVQTSEGKTDIKDIQLSKDAILALGESNDICKESKRQIISIEDVFTALEDLEFAELLPPLKQSLEVFKIENKEKSRKRSEQQKRRKLEDAENAAAAAAAAAASGQPTTQETATSMDGGIAHMEINTGNQPLPVPAMAVHMSEPGQLPQG